MFKNCFYILIKVRNMITFNIHGNKTENTKIIQLLMVSQKVLSEQCWDLRKCCIDPESSECNDIQEQSSKKIYKTIDPLRFYRA